MSFRVVIPARFSSTRLPGKPLADIGGKPMVVRVCESVEKSGASEVIVATDDERVLQAVVTHGYEAMMTRADHPSGTDRIAEVAISRGWPDSDIVVNVQGDEPLIEAALIANVATALDQDPGASIATAAHAISEPDDLFNPNVVKVVTAASGRALYFSRAPIAWHRDGFAKQREQLPLGYQAYRHIGLYAYRVGFLKRYGELAPSPIEQWESLEQLRALWHGDAIQVITCKHAPAPGVDTLEDLLRVQALFISKDVAPH